MLIVLTLQKEGFNEKVSIGESIMHNGKKYVIIRILKIEKKWYSQTQELKAMVIAQEVGTKSVYAEYKKTQIFTKRYNQNESHSKIFGVGDATYDKHGLGQMIVSINSMHYEFIDLVVEYTVELIPPWSKEEIEKALKEERLSSFKVITGGN